MDARLCVLKYGGSVLRSAEDLRAVAADVQRVCDQGAAPIVVVSALRGRTDELAAGCGSDARSPFAVAARLCAGERESAALLVDELRQRGVPARLADPLSVQMRAVGDPLDAMPTALSLPAVRALLATAPAVVVPGFFAGDEMGRTVLLGRGGSDLTALFLAERLACRCELVKDTGGLLPVEPSPADAAPEEVPLAAASHADLLRLGGGLVQPKAVRYAMQRGLAFWIRSLDGGRATQVCPQPPGVGTDGMAHG